MDKRPETQANEPAWWARWIAGWWTWRASRKDPELLARRAEQAYRQGKARLAMALYRKALRHAPDHVPSLVNLSALYLHDVTRIAAARELLERAVELDDRNGVALLNLGSLLANQGEWEAARQRLEHGLKVNPRQADLRFVLSYYYINHGDPDHAAALLREELRQRPEHTQARELLDSLDAGQGGA